MTSQATHAELLDLEKQYWQAIKNKDAEAAMRLSDDPASSPVRRASAASIANRSREW